MAVPRCLCHECGERFPEQDDLRCPYCGATRDMIETLDADVGGGNQAREPAPAADVSAELRNAYPALAVIRDAMRSQKKPPECPVCGDYLSAGYCESCEGDESLADRG